MNNSIIAFYKYYDLKFIPIQLSRLSRFGNSFLVDSTSSIGKMLFSFIHLNILYRSFPRNNLVMIAGSFLYSIFLFSTLENVSATSHVLNCSDANGIILPKYLLLFKNIFAAAFPIS